MRAPNGARLDLAECRRLLGHDCALDDRALLMLRDQLYALAAVAIAGYVADAGTTLDALAEADRVDFEERAAILEFDGRMPRPTAERTARSHRGRRRAQ